MKKDDSFIIRKFMGIPWGYAGLVTVLSLMGIVMLYSAAQGNMDPWASQHAKRFILGFFIMIVVAMVDIRFWFRYAYVIYGVALISLILVAIMGSIGMGAQRWINIGGFTIQPSEFTKISLILVLARYFHSLHLNNLQQLRVLLYPAILVVLPVILILKQPNLGTASITAFLSVGIFFAAGISIRKFLFAGVAGGALLPVAWHFMHDYQKQRVLTFLNPESDPLGAGYNIIQSKIAIGSGGFFGKGFMYGSQSQLSFLPEKQTDFIFTMLNEEFGFVGGVGVIILYGALILLGIRIAMECHSHFGKLAAFGISTMIFLHVFINMAMTMGLLPVVGVPLPLLSYGGSNLLSSLAGLGFVMNAHIYRDTRVDRS